MTYILVEIPEDGMIRCESDITLGQNSTYGCRSNIIHKTTVDLDKIDGIRVFNQLDSAKDEWSGPESNEAILSLNDLGGGENIWLAERQADRLTTRLKIWSGCYGGWPVRKLNA
jgi:hypothetical protein